MKFLFVDRIDDNKIVCEDSNGDEVILNTKNVTDKVREGDVIRVGDDGCVAVDCAATRARKEEILELRRKLKRNND